MLNVKDIVCKDTFKNDLNPRRNLRYSQGELK
nr:MAG TPA: hypothetical protein [Caudoviricetes sp.]